MFYTVDNRRDIVEAGIDYYLVANSRNLREHIRVILKALLQSP